MAVRPVGVEVLDVVGQVLVEDQGRRHRAAGFPVSGAFDLAAHTALTALLGGGASEATLEVAGRLRLRARTSLLVAVGGEVAARIGESPVPRLTVMSVVAGDVLAVSSTGHGRAYLGVVGGWGVPAVLGSRSTCLLGPVGPAAVAVGDVLATGGRDLGVAVNGPAGPVSVGDYVRLRGAPGPIRVVPGPHGSPSGTVATVQAASRIGIVLRPEMPAAAGPAPERPSTLPSLGVVPGAIQALPAGGWVILGPDCGTMGGYPVIGVVPRADLSRLAHVGAGDRVEFRVLSADDVRGEWAPAVIRVGALPG